MIRYVVVGLAVALVVTIGILLLLRPEPILIDEAELLERDEREFISEYHGYLVQDYDIDYRVFTTDSERLILEEAVDLFERIGVGSQSEWSHGLLLVINPALDQVRLEVGYSLEGTFPDAFVAYIEQRQMVPFFADGRVADGILATTELIVDRAQRAAERDGFGADEIWMIGSGGAGAQTDARIGEGYEAPSGPVEDGDRLFSPAGSPEDALSAYFRAMDARNANPNLPIYSPATQAMLDERTVTPAQMDMVVRTYRDCTAEPARYDQTGQLAVIRYPPAERRCAPLFFVKQGEPWMLDLASMSRAVRFGRTNAWHRSEAGFGEYGFAFEDWGFDGNGFPR
ncbi:MAG TPA: TPM domain-containing protein [Rhodothermales bacterium]|nr:TPM domain-containing protein [Rhodothermales bacterium]